MNKHPTLAAGAILSLLALGPAAAEVPAVPVHTAVAMRADVPVRVTGLGTVRAWNTVTIRTQVAGALAQVLFAEGGDVKAGDLLAVVDPRPFQAALDQAAAKADQDAANLANTEVNLGRSVQLGRNEFASQQTIDNLRSAVRQLQAQLAQDKAAVAAAQTQLSYTRILSPLTGRTGLRLVDQGNIVHPDDARGLVVVAQLQPIAVIATLPETDVARLRAGLAAGPVVAEAVDRGTGAVLDTGTLTVIDNAIDPASGMIQVKASLPNHAYALWPGQFVDLRLRIATIAGATTVPAAALQRGPDGFFVYTVGTDGVAALAPVRPGQIADGVAVIESGLAPGAVVVTEGQYRVAPGAHVAPAPAGG